MRGWGRAGVVYACIHLMCMCRVGCVQWCLLSGVGVCVFSEVCVCVFVIIYSHPFVPPGLTLAVILTVAFTKHRRRISRYLSSTQSNLMACSLPTM